MKTFFTILSCSTLSIFSHTFKTHSIVHTRTMQTQTSEDTNRIRAQNAQGLKILKELLQRKNIDNCIKEYTSNTTMFKMGFFNLSLPEQNQINHWLVYSGHIPLPRDNMELARLPDQALLFIDALYSYIKTQQTEDRKIWLYHIEQFVKISLQQKQSCLHALFPEYILTRIEEIAAEIYQDTHINQTNHLHIDTIEALPIELKMHIKRALLCIRISKAIRQGMIYFSDCLNYTFQKTISNLTLIPQGIKDLNKIFSNRNEIQQLVRSFLSQSNQTSEH